MSLLELLKKARQKKVLDVGLLALLLGVLVAAGLMSALVGMRLAVRSTEVTVPQVVGLDQETAKEALDGVQLGLRVTAERYDSEVPKGLVLEQFPKQGRSVKALRDVQVILSLGERNHPVPNLVGTTVRVAQLTAAQYNYEVGFVSELPDDDLEEGRVLQQFPEAGATDALSPKINLLVSAGKPGRYVMPQLVGRNMNEVTQFLEEKGFEVGRINYRFYSNVRKGTVVKQFPEVGHLLKDGEIVNLEVAR